MTSASNEFKKLGNIAFEKADFVAAVDYFTQALDHEKNHIFYSNRSAAWCSLGRYDLAEADARQVVALQPQWPKGYRRLATALRGLRRFEEAVEAARQGASGDDANPDYVEAKAELDSTLAELADGAAELAAALASATVVPGTRWHVEALADNIWLDGGAGSPPFRPQTIFIVDPWSNPPAQLGLSELRCNGPTPPQRALAALCEQIRTVNAAPETVNVPLHDAPLVPLLAPILAQHGIQLTTTALSPPAAEAFAALVAAFEASEEAQWSAESKFDHVIAQRRCVPLTRTPSLELPAIYALLAAAGAFYRCNGISGIAARPIGVAVHPTPLDIPDVVIVAGQPPAVAAGAAGGARREFGLVVLSSSGVAAGLAVAGGGPGGVAAGRPRITGSLAAPLLTYAFTDISTVPFADADAFIGVGGEQFRIPSAHGYPRVTCAPPGGSGSGDSAVTAATAAAAAPSRAQIVWLTVVLAALAEFASDAAGPASGAQQTIVVPSVDGRVSVTVIIPPPADLVPSDAAIATGAAAQAAPAQQPQQAQQQPQPQQQQAPAIPPHLTQPSFAPSAAPAAAPAVAPTASTAASTAAGGLSPAGHGGSAASPLGGTFTAGSDATQAQAMLHAQQQQQQQQQQLGSMPHPQHTMHGAPSTMQSVVAHSTAATAGGMVGMGGMGPGTTTTVESGTAMSNVPVAHHGGAGNAPAAGAAAGALGAAAAASAIPRAGFTHPTAAARAAPEAAAAAAPQQTAASGAGGAGSPTAPPPGSSRALVPIGVTDDIGTSGSGLGAGGAGAAGAPYETLVWRARAAQPPSAARLEAQREREVLLRTLATELLSVPPASPGAGGDGGGMEAHPYVQWLQQQNANLAAELRAVDADLSRQRAANAGLVAAAVQSAARERADVAAAAAMRARVASLESHVAQLVATLAASVRAGADGAVAAAGTGPRGGGAVAQYAGSGGGVGGGAAGLRGGALVAVGGGGGLMGGYGGGAGAGGLYEDDYGGGVGGVNDPRVRALLGGVGGVVGSAVYPAVRRGTFAPATFPVQPMQPISHGGQQVGHGGGAAPGAHRSGARGAAGPGTRSLSSTAGGVRGAAALGGRAGGGGAAATVSGGGMAGGGYGGGAATALPMGVGAGAAHGGRTAPHLRTGHGGGLGGGGGGGHVERAARSASVGPVGSGAGGGVGVYGGAAGGLVAGGGAGGARGGVHVGVSPFARHGGGGLSATQPAHGGGMGGMAAAASAATAVHAGGASVFRYDGGHTVTPIGAGR